MPAFTYRLSGRTPPITVEDYRRRAQRALPRMVWAYVEDGAEDLETREANRYAFARHRLRARVLTGVAAPDLRTTVAGEPLDLPVLLAPTGLAGLSHWTGESGVARAAEEAGTLSVLSTASSYSIEEVAAASERAHFFQLYPWSDLDDPRSHRLTRSLIDRAECAGYRALVLTVDVSVRGNRESERRHGIGIPPILTPGRVLDAARRPRWSANLLRHQRVSLRNLVDSGGSAAAVRSATTQARLSQPELGWDDLSWVRRHWKGPLFVKGILDPDDAVRAVGLGADGIIVSNHGGRQLDSTVAALDALPAVAAGVGERAEVLLDGGIRRGSDVVKALCLGASAVCIGRPYLYGLAAAGPPGVTHVLDILRDEMARTMTLMGVGTIRELGPSWLIPADTPLPNRPES